MEPRSPENPIPSNITLLKDKVTEVSGFGREITVRADNIGTQKWREMLRLMQETGKEQKMDMFYNPFTHNFVPGNIVAGVERGFKTGPNIPIETSEIDGLRNMFCKHVASVHTHPMGPEEAQMKTSVPSGNDLIKFLINADSAMVVIDRGGAHLLIKTREFIAKDPPTERRKTTRRPLQAADSAGGDFEGEDLPPEDLVQNKIDEVKAKDGIIADVQAELNTIFSPYGVQYFFCPTANITTLEDGTITFKTFSRADAKIEKEVLDHENRNNRPSEL